MNVNELLEWMDDETRAEWQEAIANKGCTSECWGAPECGSDGAWMPYWCDDCETWHSQWVGTCFEVFDGVPYAVDWTCDSEGNWDYMSRCSVEELDDDYNEQLYEESRIASKYYALWCLEHGEDTLGEYYAKTKAELRAVIRRNLELDEEMEKARMAKALGVKQ